MKRNKSEVAQLSKLQSLSFLRYLAKGDWNIVGKSCWLTTAKNCDLRFPSPKKRRSENDAPLSKPKIIKSPRGVRGISLPNRKKINLPCRGNRIRATRGKEKNLPHRRGKGRAQRTGEGNQMKKGPLFSLRRRGNMKKPREGYSKRKSGAETGATDRKKKRLNHTTGGRKKKKSLVKKTA